MQKAGNFDPPRELAEEEGDFLFTKEIITQNTYTLPNINNKSALLMDMSPRKAGEGKKDFIQLAYGEDDDIHSDESDADEGDTRVLKE